MMQIIAHRGINKAQNRYGESSYQAFAACLRRGWGVEFDVNFTRDKQIVIWHDNDLSRLTRGRDKRKVAEITVADFKKIKIAGSRLCDLSEILTLLEKNKTTINALHLKGVFQRKSYLDKLISELVKRQRCWEKIIIFDVKPTAARYLKKKLPKIILAASVAHQFDVKRFNKLTSGTLLILQQVIKHAKLYDWAWLDEWDRRDKRGVKNFYNPNNFSLLKKRHFKIAVVAPELHTNERHPDAMNRRRWLARLKEIIQLKPTAICTDYPTLFKL